MTKEQWDMVIDAFHKCVAERLTFSYKNIRPFAYCTIRTTAKTRLLFVVVQYGTTLYPFEVLVNDTCEIILNTPTLISYSEIDYDFELQQIRFRTEDDAITFSRLSGFWEVR